MFSSQISQIFVTIPKLGHLMPKAFPHPQIHFFDKLRRVILEEVEMHGNSFLTSVFFPRITNNKIFVYFCTRLQLKAPKPHDAVGFMGT